jgi:hypothetical protein
VSIIAKALRTVDALLAEMTEAAQRDADQRPFSSETK